MSVSTYARMAQQECANFKHGECLFTRDGKCPLMKGLRCCVSREVLFGGNPSTPGLDYFSACVAPLAKSRPEYVEAANEYSLITGNRKAAVSARKCECGSLLKPRQRVCENCARKRRLQAYRNQKAKGLQLTPKSFM